MNIYKIKGQQIFDSGEYLKLRLSQPYWGASTTFNWPKKQVGIGVSEDLVKKAESLKRKIKVTYYKNDKDGYMITTKKLRNSVGGEYNARGTKILVIPRDKFTHIKKPVGRYQGGVYVIE